MEKTDIEILCDLFRRNGIRYDIDPEPENEDHVYVCYEPYMEGFKYECAVECDTPCEEKTFNGRGCENVDGYSGFFVKFVFTKNGKLEKVGIWE